MLQRLNEKIQGVVAWVVISLVAIMFALFGVDYYLQSHKDTGVLVEVNGEPITNRVLDLTYRRIRQYQQAQHWANANEKIIKDKILHELIQNAVLTQSARLSGFEVTSDQANQAILGIPQFQEDHHFSSARYSQALSNALFTPESFQREVQQGMLLNQQKFAIIGTSFATPLDVEHYVQLYFQKRNYQYLVIPARLFIDKMIISDSDIETYYKKHKDEFVEPEKVSIDYVVLSMKEIKDKIRINESEAKDYYEENKTAFDKPFSEVKSAITAQLMVERAQKNYAKKLERLTDIAYQSPESLSPASEALKLPIKHTGLFQREEQSNYNPISNKDVRRAAFSHEVLELGNNSEVIQLNGDDVIVIHVSKRVPISEKPLSAVKEQIISILKLQKASEEALRIGSQSLSELNQWLNNHHLKWKNVRQAEREDSRVPAIINDLAFSLSRANEKGGVVLDAGDYAVVLLGSVESGELSELDKEQKLSLIQQIESNFGVIDYELYTNRLMQRAKVVKS